MSTVSRKFDFNKSYEEIEIAGKTYQIEFNDEKILQYNKSFDKFYQESKKLNEIDATKLEQKEQEDLFIKMQGLTKSMVEEILGENTYDELYKLSGNSLMNMLEMVEYLSEVVGEKIERIKGDKKKKYLVNKKQK